MSTYSGPTFLPETETTASHPVHKELQIKLLRPKLSLLLQDLHTQLCLYRSSAPGELRTAGF